MCVINITCSKITGLHKNKHGLDYHYLQILLHPIGRHLLFLSVLKTLFLNLVLHLWSFWRLLPPLRVRRLRRRWGGQGGRGVGGSLELLRVLSFPFLTFHLNAIVSDCLAHHGWGVSRPTPRDRQGTHRVAISGQMPAIKVQHDSLFTLSKVFHIKRRHSRHQDFEHIAQITRKSRQWRG